MTIQWAEYPDWWSEKEQKAFDSMRETCPWRKRNYCTATDELCLGKLCAVAHFTFERAVE
jgi:hypothetical protein